MPTYQLVAIFSRIGLALAAGVLIGLVPFFYMKARNGPKSIAKIVLYVLSIVTFIAFGFYAHYLWEKFVPASPEPPTTSVVPSIK